MSDAAGMGIVVGYDGSDFAMQALDWAMDEAELRKLPLTVAHAWQWPYGEASEESKAHLRKAADHVLWHGADCVRKTSSVTDVETDLFEGAASRRLVDLSAGADLVVVGSRGLGRLSRAVLGSVAAHVAAHALCPVIVVRGPGPLPSPAHPGPVTVVLDKDPSEAALAFAFREAAMRQLPLLAVQTGHVVVETQNGTPNALTPWRGRFAEVAVQTRVAAGSPGEALTRLSREASLVVTGRLRKAHLGSVARSVLREAVCPVAIVPD